MKRGLFFFMIIAAFTSQMFPMQERSLGAQEYLKRVDDRFQVLLSDNFFSTASKFGGPGKLLVALKKEHDSFSSKAPASVVIEAVCNQVFYKQFPYYSVNTILYGEGLDIHQLRCIYYYAEYVIPWVKAVIKEVGFKKNGKPKLLSKVVAVVDQCQETMKRLESESMLGDARLFIKNSFLSLYAKLLCRLKDEAKRLWLINNSWETEEDRVCQLEQSMSQWVRETFVGGKEWEHVTKQVPNEKKLTLKIFAWLQKIPFEAVQNNQKLKEKKLVTCVKKYAAVYKEFEKRLFKEWEKSECLCPIL